MHIKKFISSTIIVALALNTTVLSCSGMDRHDRNKSKSAPVASLVPALELRSVDRQASSSALSSPHSFASSSATEKSTSGVALKKVSKSIQKFVETLNNNKLTETYNNFITNSDHLIDGKFSSKHFPGLMEAVSNCLVEQFAHLSQQGDFFEQFNQVADSVVDSVKSLCHSTVGISDRGSQSSGGPAFTPTSSLFGDSASQNGDTDPQMRVYEKLAYLKGVLDKFMKTATEWKENSDVLLSQTTAEKSVQDKRRELDKERADFEEFKKTIETQYQIVVEKEKSIETKEQEIAQAMAKFQQQKAEIEKTQIDLKRQQQVAKEALSGWEAQQASIEKITEGLKLEQERLTIARNELRSETAELEGKKAGLGSEIKGLEERRRNLSQLIEAQRAVDSSIGAPGSGSEEVSALRAANVALQEQLQSKGGESSVSSDGGWAKVAAFSVAGVGVGAGLGWLLSKFLSSSSSANPATQAS